MANGIQMEKILSFEGTKSQMLMSTAVFCALKGISQEKRVDTVSGIVSAVVSRTLSLQ